MSVPTPVRQIIGLVEDLALKRSPSSVSPTTLSIEFKTLVRALREPASGRAPRLIETLKSVSFVSTSLASDAVRLGDDCKLLGAAMLRYEFYLDLEVDGASAPLLSSLQKALGEKARWWLARLRVRFEVDPTGWDVAARHAEMVKQFAGSFAGQCLIMVDLSGEPNPAEFLPHTLWWIQKTGGLSVVRPLDLEIRWPTPPSEDALEATLANLEKASAKAAINLRVPGLMHWTFGPPQPFAHVWNVMQSALRSTFKAHPHLCPFPFLWIRYTAESLGSCPMPNGPSGPQPETGTLWSAPHLEATRRAFFEGQIGIECLECTLLPRILHSLREAPADVSEELLAPRTDFPV